MKKNLLTLALVLCGSLTGLQAQVSHVNPIPHEVTPASGALFAAPAEWTVVCDKSLTGSYVLEALSEAAPRQVAKAGFKVTVGVRGQKVVKSYTKKVPARAEAYYLHIDPNGAVIAGADLNGAYYGVQTLLAIMRDGQLQTCDIRDYPDVRFRGVVEGFYGTPWSQEHRLRQLDFYGRNKMNVYIYGPKDDPWHRDHWRTPYPEAEGRKIHILAERAKKRGVNFYWAIHPGVDIKWTAEDRDALIGKLESMYGLGVRAFAIFFDDIWGENADAAKQADLLNYIDDNFVQKKPDVSPLVLCPSIYNRAWATDDNPYLGTMAEKLNKGIEIMWTGNTVVHCLDKEAMEWANRHIGRKAYIWWNYPVSDYVRDRILLGPTYGNGLDIAEDLGGFVSNPMEHAEASKVSLYSIADYTWNMAAYDQARSWERALQDLLPENAGALRVFALYNEDPGPNGHGFRRDESRHLQALADKALAGDAKAVETLQRHAQALRTAANTLLADRSNELLIRELKPWLLQAKLAGEYGEAVTRMCLAADGGARCADVPLQDFECLYGEARALQQQMYDLENSSVRHPLQPGIKVGARVYLPLLSKLFRKHVEAYNARTGKHLDPIAEFQPYLLETDVAQLRNQAVSVNGADVTVAPVLEVVTWAPGAQLTIVGERVATLNGMEFDLGTPGMAPNFRLEVFDGERWNPVSLLHYKEGETMIHTGQEIAGMKALKLRLTNVSGKEQKLYFKSLRFVKQ